MGGRATGLFAAAGGGEVVSSSSSMVNGSMSGRCWPSASAASALPPTGLLGVSQPHEARGSRHSGLRHVADESGLSVRPPHWTEVQRQPRLFAGWKKEGEAVSSVLLRSL